MAGRPVSQVIKMGADALPVAVMTSIFGVVGLILPFALARGPNKGVVMVDLVITACTGWLVWLLTYMHQMNPLIGPQLHNTTILAVQYLWDNNLHLSNHSDHHAEHAAA
ncbi:V-type proton ATPase subunit e 2-like [Eriocheir sinensis]|uniref:V-type proton ATPase subunit e 2-like n=1 Tax=Eriocheir sinensis TaxID=95602 RepID=UPI0021C98758|nr:V-type proton ATPase subunit e 2-like [Eriocheir sinensis]